jgi:ribonuclease HI
MKNARKNARNRLVEPKPRRIKPQVSYHLLLNPKKQKVLTTSEFQWDIRFTDGSTSSTHSAGAIYLPQANTSFQFKLNIKNNYLAELTAIYFAIISSISKVNLAIYTDSLSCLQAISSSLNKKKSITINKTGHHLLLNIRDLLRSRKGATLIDYIPSHIVSSCTSRSTKIDFRHQHNETCDKLAKAALMNGTPITLDNLIDSKIYLADNRTQNAIQGSVGNSIFNIFNQNCWTNWSNSKQGSITLKLALPIEDNLYKNINNRLIKYHIKLRTNSIPVNHILSKFTFQKRKIVLGPSCPICKNEDETLDHYLFQCKPLMEQRLKNFEEIESLALSRLSSNLDSIKKLKIIFQDLKKEFKSLDSQKDNIEASNVARIRIISFLNGFLTSPPLLLILKIFRNTLKCKRKSKESRKITTNYNTANKEFKSLITFIRLKEYECWKTRSSFIRASQNTH